MTYIHAISSTPAETHYNIDQVFSAAQLWLADKPSEYALFERFHRASKTVKRHYVLSLQEILKLTGQAERAILFAQKGAPLMKRVISDALALSNLKASDISSVVFTSCTCPLIPSLDAEVLEQMGFSPFVRRVPIYQQGCAGGAVGLALADRLCGTGENVLLISLELCSLLFRLRESSPVHLLGSALFSDGAAATVVSSRAGRLKLLRSQSYLIPESRQLMGYEIRDDGAHLLLDRDLPSRLQGVLQKIVGDFLLANNIKNVDWWVIHPGGVKILDGIVSLLGLDRQQCSWAYDVLSEIGNMSSATVQFVLQRCINCANVSCGEIICLVGIGPGLTIELLAYEVQ